MQIDKLIQIIGNPDKSKPSLDEAVLELSKMGNQLDDVIVHYFRNSDNSFLLYNLIKVIKLRKSASDDIVNLISNFARKSNHNHIRMISFSTLAEVGNYDLVAEIIKMLEQEDDNLIKEEMIYLIGNLNNKYPMEVLIDKLVDNDHFVREQASDAILELHEYPIKKLIDTLKKTESLTQKIEIINTLRLARNKKAIPILESMLNDENEHVRADIEFALKDKNTW